MKPTITTVLASAILAGIMLTGCSPTGWATREIPDGSNLSQGEHVQVVLKDGSTVSGEFTGSTELSTDAYRAMYERSISQSESGWMLPLLGQTIEVTTNLDDKKVWSGVLLGFDQVNVWIRPPGESEPQQFYIASITGITHRSGSMLEKMEFRNLYMNGAIPLRSALAILDNGSEVQVPLNSVDKITRGAALLLPAGAATALSETESTEAGLLQNP